MAVPWYSTCFLYRSYSEHSKPRIPQFQSFFPPPKESHEIQPPLKHPRQKASRHLWVSGLEMQFNLAMFIRDVWLYDSVSTIGCKNHHVVAGSIEDYRKAISNAV